MEGILCIISNLVYQNIYFLVNFFFSVKKRWNVEVAYDDLFD